MGLASTAMLYLAILRTTLVRDRIRFLQTAERLDEAILQAAGREALVLNATAGAISANPDMTPQEFRTYYDALRRSTSAPPPAALGFSTEHSESGTQSISLIEPLEGENASLIGRDVLREPVRRNAVELAKRVRATTMSSRLVLRVDRKSPKPAFILYIPIYDAAGKPLGMAFSGLRARELFDPLDRTLDDAKIGLRIWSGPAKPENLVFERPASKPGVPGEISTLRLPELHQTLTRQYIPADDFATPPLIRRWVVPIGTLLSLLLFALANTLRRSQEASERRGVEGTLLAEVGRLTMGDADNEATLQELASKAADVFAAVCRIDLVQDGSLQTVTTQTEGIEALTRLEERFPRLEYDTLLRKALEEGTLQNAPAYPLRNAEHRATLEALNVGPVLIAPLWLGDRSLGALSFLRSKGESAFNHADESLATTIAGRLCLAIENVRLLRDLEHRVEERTRDLEASNKELESFCYSVSHDLRTPLRSLDGFGRALQEDYANLLDAQGMDYIDRIIAATRRMDELITALLTLSRLTRREIVPTEVDVTTMVGDQMRDLDPQGRITVITEPGLTTHADPRMLAVLFDNLLGNAVKFSGRTESPRIEVGRNDQHEIFVRDNGAGFDMAYANKLFQPFERLHSVREFPGHGIGLATVERIVRRHGGSVRAEGSPGEGATFYFRL